MVYPEGKRPSEYDWVGGPGRGVGSRTVSDPRGQGTMTDTPGECGVGCTVGLTFTNDLHPYCAVCRF